MCGLGLRRKLSILKLTFGEIILMRGECRIFISITRIIIILLYMLILGKADSECFFSSSHFEAYCMIFFFKIKFVQKISDCSNFKSFKSFIYLFNYLFSTLIGYAKKFCDQCKLVGLFSLIFLMRYI